MALRILGFGAPLLDVAAAVDEEFLRRHVSGARGGREEIGSEERRKLLGLLPAARVVSPGGATANTLRALAHLGTACALLGKLGRDPEARIFRERTLSAGVDCGYLFESETPTGCCFALVTPDAERTMRAFPGASHELTAHEVQRVDFGAFDWVHVEGYMLFLKETFDAVIAGARRAGCRIALDLASFEVVSACRSKFDQLFGDGVDLIFANAGEAAALTGETLCSRQLEQLARRCRIAVLKRGAAGSMVSGGQGVFSVPAHPAARVADTTGAGDFYAAGFLAALSEGRSLRTAAAYGSIAAAAVIQDFGTELSAAAWRGVKESMQQWSEYDGV